MADLLSCLTGVGQVCARKADVQDNLPACKDFGFGLGFGFGFKFSFTHC